MNFRKYLGAVAFFMTAFCTNAHCAQGDYVQVRNGRFYIGEKPYTYVGTNFWYGAILASEGRGGNRAQLKSELDVMQKNGINNLRVLIGGDGREGDPHQIRPVLQPEPGVYNDTILRGLDYLMAELEKRDMKVVLYMTNAWEWSGGNNTYLQWAGMGQPPASSDWPGYQAYGSQFYRNERAMEMAANNTRFLVSRINTVTGKPYKESTALMAWELCNEPRPFANTPEQKVYFEKWIASQSALIKSIDPNHLVTTGSEGKYGCESDMDLFRRIHTLPTIDYCCIHIWPFNWAWLGAYYATAKEALENLGPEAPEKQVKYACEQTQAYIDEAYKCMEGTGRPIVLEEFGFPRDGFQVSLNSTTHARDTYYKYVFDIIRTSGKIQGCNFWSWAGTSRPSHTFWQPWDEYTGDPAQEEQGLNSVFDTDKTTLKLIKNFSKHNK